MNDSNITLEFSGKYDSKHSLDYYKKHKDSIGRRLSNRLEIESEFREAGFDILGLIDFAKYYSMWRIYVLRKNIIRANET